MIPLKAMLDAGKYFLKKQNRSTGISEKEIIKIAVKSLGLSDLVPFKPEEKIIEYRISQNDERKLVSMDLSSFAYETASESPAPGGGSISAYMGALGAALGTMVANLSSHKRGWDDRWEEFSDWAEKGQSIVRDLIWLVDEDTMAFNRILNAFGLPKGNPEEKAERKKAIDEATVYAIEIPFKVMQKAFESLEVIYAMAKTGNPNSSSDAGVGALAAVAAIKGAFLNVKTNASSLDDKKYVENKIKQGQEIVDQALIIEKDILEIVESSFTRK
jgi:glutamate formiminotransferase/formiminotetrahydrofolate cyclodeaminase